MPDFAQFGASGAVVVVVLLFLRFIQQEATKRDQTYAEIAKSLNKLTAATEKNTDATKSADAYLKQRNGRDIEKHTELLKATQAIPRTLKRIAADQAVAIIRAVKVDHQYVENAQITTQVVAKKS